MQVDRNALAGALLNLLQNAFKYTSEDKQISLRARADISAFLGQTAHLFLTVKVRPNWQEEKERYSEMGLDFRDGDA